MSSLEDEAERRTGIDGIPRFITDDGHIMKYDWYLSPEDMEDYLDEVALESHIARLMAEQQ